MQDFPLCLTSSNRIAKIMNYDDAESQDILKRMLLKRKRIIHKAANKKDAFKEIIEKRLQEHGNLKYSLVYVPEGMKPQGKKADIYEIEEDVYDGNNRYTTYKESDPSYKKVYAGETANWARFISLLKQAGKACREICPNAKIILHTERVPNTSYLNTYYSLLKNEGIDFDIIGLSYYPYHHGPLTNLNNALNILETNFDKDIMIVETGYYHAYYPTKDVKYPKTSFPTWPDTEAGQLQFTKDLIEQLNNHTKVKGLYWWFLEANEYGLDWNTKRVTDDWYNASLFDNSTGKAMSAIAELKSFLGDPSGIETINREPLTVNQHAWYTLDGRKLNGAPNQRGIYIHNGKKMVVR